MRGFNNTSRAAIMVALIGLAAPVFAQTKFTIISRVDQESTAQIDLERWLDFEANVSLKVRTDPALVPTARVIELVESIPMVDDAGIVRVRDQPSGLEVAALFKDHQGKIVTPPQGSLAAYTTGGQRLCFDQSVVEREVDNPVPMAFTLLLDRSGSMNDVIDEVRQAALGFIAALPDTAQCTVVAFGTSYSVDPGQGLGTNSCRAENFLHQPLGLDGTTDLFTPLGWTYSTLAAPHMADHQKAVIILTDGGVNERTKDVVLMEALKRDALTFV